jgi:hypothetical protein
VAGTDTGTLTTTTPEQARYTWPRRLLVGILLVAVAVAVLVVPSVSGRLVLGAAALAALGRGAQLVRAAGNPRVGPDARGLGAALLAGGVAGLVVAVLSEAAAGRVLVVGVPVALLFAAAALTAHGPASRLAGRVVLAVGLVLTVLLVAVGLARGWAAVAGLASGIGAIALAGLGVALGAGAVALRGVAGRPASAAYPAPAGGCGGACGCGEGGCGALGG